MSIKLLKWCKTQMRFRQPFEFSKWSSVLVNFCCSTYCASPRGSNANSPIKMAWTPLSSKLLLLNVSYLLPTIAHSLIEFFSIKVCVLVSNMSTLDCCRLTLHCQPYAYVKKSSLWSQRWETANKFEMVYIIDFVLLSVCA